MLAVQNLKGEDAFDPNSEHGVEYDALESSLQLMSQVLNDVLDFSRMERGGFSSVHRPFSLHKAMQSIVTPLRLDAAARGLDLEATFDHRVDNVAVAGTYPDDNVSDVSLGDGILIGDEVRLRQIIGNLASNAAKFTAPGGKIGLKTTLIYPLPDEQASPAPTLPTGTDFAEKDAEKGAFESSLTPNKLHELEAKTSEPVKKMLVVRFEISDTGVGIRPSDMAENRLFSPYVQTAVGREQGGKGTGLGLSLVRQIVMLMGGRLGVRSKFGEGTTMWVELAYPIATAAEAATASTSALKRDHRGSVVSPGVASSAASDYRFVSSLRLQPSSTTLDSLDDSARKRGLSVSTTPTAASSRPGSPPGGSTPAALTAGTLWQVESSSPETATPSGLLPAARPVARSQVSSQSAPGGVTLAPEHQSLAALPSASPVVSAAPTQRPHTSSGVASAPNVVASGSASKSNAAAVKAAAANKLGIDGPPLKVLVVDDDNLTRRLMSRMMLRLGCQVESAENGKIALDMILKPPPPGANNVPAVRLEMVSEEAEPSSDSHDVPARAARDLDAAERGDGIIVKRVKMVGMDPTAGIDAFQHYDIVFLDNQMPVCSGVQVVTKLRSLGRDDLVVGVTANALQSDQEQYLESGASYILTKPVKEEDLVRHLRLADKRRTERADPTLRAQRQAKMNASGPHFPPINSIIGPLDDDDDM